MKKTSLQKWLVRIGIIFVLTISIFIVQTYAQAGGAANRLDKKDVSAGGAVHRTDEPVPSTPSALEKGGSGLTIVEDRANISTDIVQDRNFGELVKDIINYFLGFLGFLAVIVFVYAGVLWVISGGNEEAITKSKKIMTYAALGLIIVLLSYSIVQFITSSAGTDSCSSNGDCDTGYICVDPNPNDDDGTKTCSPGSKDSFSASSVCRASVDCSSGQYCSVELNVCVDGNNISCTSDSDCSSPGICSDYGYCRNPNADSDSSCLSSADCPPYPNYVCNLETNKCEVGGTDFDGDGGDSGDGSEDGGGDGSEDGGGDGGEGGDSGSEFDDDIDEIEDTFDDLEDVIENIDDLIDKLPSDVKDEVMDVLVGDGTLSDKIADMLSLIDETDDPAVLAILERILKILELLRDLRSELDELRLVMPESKITIKAWDESSEAIDSVIDDPTSGIKFKRFQKKYRALIDMIRKFPVVVSRIRAVPGKGNVPFTVTFNGMNSIDPTGGTISEYKWSYLDNESNPVSLGSKPVVIHDFTEPNAYSIQLQVSTSNKDSDGYKTAADGISKIVIHANLPSSKVAFRINGTEVGDVYHITLNEAKAGLAFDPSSTVPALGRIIEKYEWNYGDTSSETRTVPTTVIHSFNKVGEYFVTLKVSDNHGITDKHVVKLFVKSLAADINIKPSNGDVNTEFHFEGIKSRSDDGVIKDYKWEIENADKEMVAESDEENFYHRFNKPGKYNVSLVVTDTTGASDRHIVVLDVYSRIPVANFSYNIPKNNHPNIFEFNALNSYDPDEGDSVKYSWDFDGDGDFDIVDTSDIKVSYEYKIPGEYRVTLQVEDSFNKRAQMEKGVSVKSVLSGDIILSSRAVKVGDEVVFRADSSNSVAYLWEFGDGETASTEEDTVKYTYRKKGKYKVKLNLFDDDDNDNYDQTYILVGGRDTPVAFAQVSIDGRDQLMHEDLCGPDKHGIIATRIDNIMLSAKNSINRDGSSRMLSYNWKLDDGVQSSRKEFTHKFSEVNRDGECFSAGVVVRDQISGKVSDEDILYFKVINEIPTLVDFIVSGERGKELITPVKVNLKAVVPNDKDGHIKKYRWWYYREGYENNKLGVHTTDTSETEMIITAEGEPEIMNRYFFVLEVTDNDKGVYNTSERFGELSSVDVKNGPNLSPVAEFTLDKTTISVGDSITFVSKSYDPQGDILLDEAYKWDFDGDGEFDDVSSGPQVNRQFNTPGEYTVRLKVIHRGLSSSVTKTIYVEQVDTFPQAAFTYNVDGNTVSFDATNSRYDSDLDDISLRYEWDFDTKNDDNGNGVKDDDVQSTELSPSYTYSESGIYIVRLKIKDSLGMEGVVVRDINLDMSADERRKNTYSSLRVTSPNQPLTTLDISVTPINVPSGGTADVSVNVLNADNSPYYGDVFFEVTDGSGSFTPNPVQSKDSRASAIFTAVDSGTVRIKIRAVNTYYGEITEEAILNVK